MGELKAWLVSGLPSFGLATGLVVFAYIQKISIPENVSAEEAWAFGIAWGAAQAVLAYFAPRVEAAWVGHIVGTALTTILLLGLQGVLRPDTCGPPECWEGPNLVPLGILLTAFFGLGAGILGNGLGTLAAWWRRRKTAP